MLGYGRDESAPTPGGMFCGVSWVDVGILRNVLWAFRGWTWVYCNLFAALLQTVSSIIANRYNAYGTDLSCPYIGKHTRNGGRICVFDNVKTRVR